MADSQNSTGQRDDAPDVARAYDSWAASYDTDSNPTRDLDADVVRMAPLAITGRDVLELGCGTGKNTVWLAAQARTVVAIDFSRGMLVRARERVEAAHVRFVQHDLRTPWPLADGAVDTVVGNLVLEHVEDLSHVYAEAARVLRPAGQLWLCELHPDRQRRGGQAQFTTSEGETVRVAAYLHSVAEYVNGGIAAGFTLRRVGEWLETDAPQTDPPRLLSLLFERVGTR
jgi:malonyl-CoA O-methyltransferase